MNFIKTILNKAKDATVQLAAKFIINKYKLDKLGTMTSLNIDSDKRQIFIALDLHGEQTPIELTIHYQVVSPTCLEIREVQSSRTWIATLVNEMIPSEKKRVEVPTALITALSKMIH